MCFCGQLTVNMSCFSKGVGRNIFRGERRELPFNSEIECIFFECFVTTTEAQGNSSSMIRLSDFH